MNLFQAIAATSLLSVACVPALPSDQTHPNERIANTIQSMNTENDQRIGAKERHIVILYTDTTNPVWLQKALHLDDYFSVAYLNASSLIELPNALDQLHASISGNNSHCDPHVLLGSSPEARALASAYLREYDLATELPLPADHEDLSLLLSLTDALHCGQQRLAKISNNDPTVSKITLSNFHSQ